MGLYLIPVHSPHICYTYEGKRYHGDCEAHKNGNDQEHNSESSRLYSKDYICYDVINGSDNYFNSQKLSIKNYNSASLYDAPVALVVVFTEQGYFSAPEHRCNTGPPLLSNLLRAPPFV